MFQACAVQCDSQKPRVATALVKVAAASPQIKEGIIICPWKPLMPSPQPPPS